jgi:hypothetical protein
VTENPYFPIHPDAKWGEELLRRISATLVFASDYLYDQIAKEYQETGDEECLDDLCTIEESFEILWPALLNDMERATKQ